MVPWKRVIINKINVLGNDYGKQMVLLFAAVKCSDIYQDLSHWFFVIAFFFFWSSITEYMKEVTK